MKRVFSVILHDMSEDQPTHIQNQTEQTIAVIKERIRSYMAANSMNMRDLEEKTGIGYQRLLRCFNENSSTPVSLDLVISLLLLDNTLDAYWLTAIEEPRQQHIRSYQLPNPEEVPEEALREKLAEAQRVISDLQRTLFNTASEIAKSRLADERQERVEQSLEVIKEQLSTMALLRTFDSRK